MLRSCTYCRLSTISLISLVLHLFSKQFERGVLCQPTVASPTQSSCFPAPDVSRQICSEYVNNCTDDGSAFSRLVRLSCPSSCGTCADPTEFERYRPSANETLQAYIGAYFQCNFSHLVNILNGWKMWIHMMGGEGLSSVIPLGDGWLKTDLVLRSICPKAGFTEITCDQVREAATDLATNENINLAVIFGDSWCPTAATEIYGEADILHYVVGTVALPSFPYHRYRYYFFSDGDDYHALIRQAEVEGIRRIGVSYANTGINVGRSKSFKAQLEEYGTESSLEIVYDEYYTQFIPDRLVYSLSEDEYIEAYDVSEWDEILLEMQAAGVEYAVFFSFGERVSIMNRIADLEINFKHITFDKEDDVLASFLGRKADFVTSTLEYHHSTTTTDDLFGSNEDFIQEFESVIGDKPRVWDMLSLYLMEAYFTPILAAESFHTEKVMAALKSVDVNTLSGRLKLSLDNVALDLNTITVQFQDGKMETVFPFDKASSSIVMLTPSWECRPLLYQLDPSVCTDVELAVWNECTINFPVVRTAFNTTACAARARAIRESGHAEAKNGVGSEGNALRRFFPFLVAFGLMLFIAVALFIWVQKTVHQWPSYLWLQEFEITYIFNDMGDKEVLRNTNVGLSYGAKFRGIPVIIQIVRSWRDIPTSKTRSFTRSTNPSSVRRSHQTFSSVEGNESCEQHTDFSNVSKNLRRTNSLGLVQGLAPEVLRIADDAPDSDGQMLEDPFDLVLCGTPTRPSTFCLSSTMPFCVHWYSMREFTVNATRIMNRRHPNLLTLLGAFEDKEKQICLVKERMDAGILHDYLRNVTTNLEPTAAVNVLVQVAEALLHLHTLSPPVIHGDLNSSNIHIDHHLTAKVDAANTVHNCDPRGSVFWIAPELFEFLDSETLQRTSVFPSEVTDVFSFGMLIWEVFSRQEPYATERQTMQPVEIIRAMTSGDLRLSVPTHMPKELEELMEECCHKNPLRRPQMKEVLTRLRVICGWMQSEVQNRSVTIQREATLLRQVLPIHVVEALRQGNKVEPETFSSVTILFSGIVGFADISSILEPQEVMNMLDRLYTELDLECTKHCLFKVETIGDTYMCVGGLPDKQEDQTVRVVLFGMAAIKAANSIAVHKERPELGHVQMLVGIHTGSVIASVVGELNPRYCLFGDTVNITSRMASNSEAGKINLSPEANRQLAAQCPGVRTSSRGFIHIKGKGTVECFFVEQSLEIEEMCESALLVEEM